MTGGLFWKLKVIKLREIVNQEKSKSWESLIGLRQMLVYDSDSCTTSIVEVSYLMRLARHPKPMTETLETK
jgi:hypothetical protein